MTDRAPRPEGMSDARLAEIVAELSFIGAADAVVDAGWTFDAVTDLANEVNRLRAEGATLKVRADEAHAAHAASFGALQTLSAALFDGEVDDYSALAEKIITRVRQLESDGATLRERVKELERRSGVMNVCVVCKQRKPVCCGFDESARGLHDPMHPDRDFPGPSWCADCCQKHKPATTPKEPESKRCSHCGCEWRGTPPTPDECPSCGATL